MSAAREQVHGTAISCAGRAALLRGPSGAGKSDLALRCLALGRSDLVPSPFRLVADDRVDLEAGADSVYVTAPSGIAGLIEVRGLGIFEVDCAEWPILALVVDLAPGVPLDRLPPPELETILGHPIRRVRLDPLQHAAPVKVAMALLGTERT